MSTPNQSAERVDPGTLVVLGSQDQANPAVPYDTGNPFIDEADITEPPQQRVSGNDNPDPQQLQSKAKELDKRERDLKKWESVLRARSENSIKALEELSAARAKIWKLEYELKQERRARNLQEELITSRKATTGQPESTYRSESGNVYPQTPPNFDPSRPPPDVHPPAALPNNPYLEMLLRSLQGDLMQLKWTMGYRDVMGYNKQMPSSEPRSQPKSQQHLQHRRHNYQPPAPRQSSMNVQQTVAPPRTSAGDNELPIDLSTTTSAHIHNSDKKKAHPTGTDAENAPQMRQEAGKVLQVEPLDLSMPKPPETIPVSDQNNTQSFLGIGPIHHRLT